MIKNNKIIIEGNRNVTDGLWDVKLPMHPTQLLHPRLPEHHSINYIITKDKTKTQLAQYLLATAFSPALSTFKHAIDNGNFVTWPCIAELRFKSLLGTTIPIQKGHMDQERKTYVLQQKTI